MQLPAAPVILGCGTFGGIGGARQPIGKGVIETAAEVTMVVRSRTPSGGSIVATTPTPAQRSESRGLLKRLVDRDDDWAQTFRTLRAADSCAARSVGRCAAGSKALSP